jgi:hypothetical protein
MTGLDAAVDPATPILLRVYVDGVLLPVEPPHVGPRQALEELVLRQDADVLGEVSVINPARFQVQHLRGEKAGEPIGPGVLMMISVNCSRWT